MLSLPDGAVSLDFATAAGPVSLPWSEIPEGFGSMIFEQDRFPQRQTVTVAAGDFVIRHVIEGDVFRFTTGKTESRRALYLYYCTNILDLAPGETVCFAQTLSIKEAR